MFSQQSLWCLLVLCPWYSLNAQCKICTPYFSPHAAYINTTTTEPSASYFRQILQAPESMDRLKLKLDPQKFTKRALLAFSGLPMEEKMFGIERRLSIIAWPSLMTMIGSSIAGLTYKKNFPRGINCQTFVSVFNYFFEHKEVLSRKCFAMQFTELRSTLVLSMPMLVAA